MNEIEDYNPPTLVGMKFITSMIIHGNDKQRTQIVETAEKFSNKKIRRTDLLSRHP